MKIGLIAPITLRIPPRRYGGTELVVSMLADGLAAAGHDVTLFASGDSITKAKLEPTWETALVTDTPTEDLTRRFIYTNAVIAGHVAEQAGDFDILHSHIDENALILSKISKTPLVSTIHSKLDQEFQLKTYQYYDHVNYVALTKNQRDSMPGINWCEVVYNGVDTKRFVPADKPKGDYLFFIGRIAPEKNPVAAIEIAKKAGERLVIAAKVDPADTWYFDQEIKPRLKDYPKAEFIGEVGSDSPEKVELYQNAKALLFPIDWEEPFGLVMTEALACGTPVLATRRGSVPEIVEDGVTGFVRDTNDELAAAVAKLGDIDRATCRQRGEDFAADKMVANYIKVYEKVLRGDS